MKGEDRAEQPGPRSDFNRKDKTATSRGCEVCGEPLQYGDRLCSYRCYAEFRRDRPIARWAESDECEMCGQDDCDCPPIALMTPEQMVTEMEGVFARLATYEDEETTP